MRQEEDSKDEYGVRTATTLKTNHLILADHVSPLGFQAANLHVRRAVTDKAQTSMRYDQLRFRENQVRKISNYRD